MPFLSDQNNQLPPLGPGRASLGPTTGFGENFWQSFEHQRRVDSQFAVESELYERYTENLSHLEELGVEPPPIDFGLSHMRELYLRERGSDRIDPRFDTDLKKWREYEERIVELKEQNPELMTFKEMLGAVAKDIRRVDEETAEVSGRAGFAGLLGEFAGGMAGSIGPRDPALTTSLFFPGAGSTAARRILAEMGIGAGLESWVQFGTVQPRREEFGLPEQSPLASILFAGFGAGAFRGAIEGAGPGFRAVESQLFPERAQARVLQEGFAESNMLSVAEWRERLRGNPLADEELRAAVARLPDTPQVRAAIHGLDSDLELIRRNPYGQSRAARLRLAKELQEQEMLFNGEVVPPHLRTDTAVGRFIENELIQMGDRAEEGLGRQVRPELYQELDATAARVDELDAEIRAIEDELQGRTMADAIEQVDPATARRVQEIEGELDTAIPRARREELQRELDLITENLDREALVRLEQETQSGLKKQLRSARQSRRAARKRLRRVRKPVEELEAELRTESDASFAGMVRPEEDLRRVTADLGRELEEFDPDVAAERIVAASPREDGRVEVGDDAPIPENFRGEEMTAKEVMDDLREDDRMVKAMKECAV